MESQLKETGRNIFMNIQIAIVDDSRPDRAMLIKRTDNYMRRHNLEYHLYEFESGEAFLASLPARRFDLVFLDIYMEGINGLDTAKALYEKDRDCRIIFLTSSPDYSVLSYSVHAVYYLLKPIEDEPFEQAMEFCRLAPCYDVPQISVVSEGVPITIDTGRILYLEYVDRQTLLHLAPAREENTETTLCLTGSFKQITAPLTADRRFLVCIRGIMINMQYVTQEEDGFFVLTTGKRIPINIRNKSSISRTYRSYIFDNLGENL